MFNKQTTFEKLSFDTLVGSNTELKGDINSKGIIRIDGRVDGNISVQGDLYIGETALIKGDVTASNIFIAGRLEGNISSAGFLKLLSKSKLTGDVQVKSFICEEGSIFDGTCKMADFQVSDILETSYKKKDPQKQTCANDFELRTQSK